MAQRLNHAQGSTENAAGSPSDIQSDTVHPSERRSRESEAGRKANDDLENNDPQMTINASRLRLTPGRGNGVRP